MCKKKKNANKILQVITAIIDFISPEIIIVLSEFNVESL